MTRLRNRRGSVLVMALWIIAILSVMVVSFAFEARQQAGIDVYVRERNRVRRLIDSGRVLGEAVLLNYKDAKDPEVDNGEPDWNDLFEGDRWCVEKWNLKNSRKCKIGPICLAEADKDEDSDDSDAPTVTVELQFDGAIQGIDLNCLYDGSGDAGSGQKSANGSGGKGQAEDAYDKEYADMWRIILRTSGIDDELEVEVDEADRSGTKRHNLMNLLIASWQDWRDSNDVRSKGPLTDDQDYRHNPQEDDGAEKAWYDERDEEDEIPVKDRRVPANGPVKQLEELSYIRGFRDFPSVLIGGRLYDGASVEKKSDKEDEENPLLVGIMDFFKLSGGAKIELNDRTRRKDLLVHLSLFSEDLDDMNEKGDTESLADAILETLYVEPDDVEDRIPQIDDSGRKWWPYKDLDDLRTRIDDFGCDVDVPAELGERVRFSGGESGTDSSGERFSMTITGESLGMKYVVKARCVIVDKKVQYVEWSENEVTNENH